MHYTLFHSEFTTVVQYKLCIKIKSVLCNLKSKVKRLRTRKN